MKVLCLGNQKGGCSKTSSCLNLCYSLSNAYNKKVLLIDMDSQGSSSLNLGIDISDDETNTIDKLLGPVVMREKKGYDWKRSNSTSIHPHISLENVIQKIKCSGSPSMHHLASIACRLLFLCLSLNFRWVLSAE